MSPSQVAALEGVVVVVRLKVRTGDEETVRSALEQVAVLTRAEPGCLQYSALRSTADPGTFLVYERYVDDEALQRHLESDYVRALAGEPPMQRLEDRSGDKYAIFA